jgi:hypothetical protein
MVKNRTCHTCGVTMSQRAMWESDYRPGEWKCRSLQACAARLRRVDNAQH